MLMLARRARTVSASPFTLRSGFAAARTEQPSLSRIVMTPYQLDQSANAPCTRTMVGLAGCAVATVPVSKRPTNAQTAMKIFI